MNWSVRVLLLIVLGSLFVVVSASPAEAHGQLALSVPAKDSKVGEPLEAVSLYFTEKPVSHTYFTVTAPSGARVDRPWSHGEIKRLDDPVREFFLVNGVWEPRLYHEGFEVRIPVAHWPEKGVYVAHYETVASDGDVVRGDIRFTYTGRTTRSPKGWTSPTDTPEPIAPSPASEGRDTGEVAPVGPRADASPACTPRSMPETGCGNGSESQAEGSPAAAPGTPGEPSSSSGWLVWLVPVLLVAGTAVMVARAARPRQAGGPTPRGRSRPGPRPSPRPPAPRRNSPGKRR
ncbi:copper resistance CopC family protein [Sphaerisporangium dianthi]|uniref:Copper resistance protein CopC n=1 Tax=Sphaerisporangium dianthi TaxID=1436120 RepID=A0ABV9CQ80_9ACTN